MENGRKFTGTPVPEAKGVNTREKTPEMRSKTAPNIVQMCVHLYFKY